MAPRQIDDVIKGRDKWFIREMEEDEEEKEYLNVCQLKKRGRSVPEIDLIYWPTSINVKQPLTALLK